MDWAFRILLLLMIAGWLLKGRWEKSFTRRTGRPASDLWRTPTKETAESLRKVSARKNYNPGPSPAAPPAGYTPPTAAEHSAAMERIRQNN